MSVVQLFNSSCCCSEFAVVTERGNPDNIASIYSGTSTDFTNTDPVIYRPPLFRSPEESSHVPEYRLLRTEQDSRWLNGKQISTEPITKL